MRAYGKIVEAVVGDDGMSLWPVGSGFVPGFVDFSMTKFCDYISTGSRTNLRVLELCDI